MTGLSIPCRGKIIQNLTIRGVRETQKFDLPTLLTHDYLPNCLNEVATPESVKAHPSISKYHTHFNPVDPSNSVMLLIGRDSGSLIGTQCFGDEAPYVHKTKLGYAVVGLKQASNAQNYPLVLRTSLAVPEHFEAKFSLPSPKISGHIPIIENSLARQLDDEMPGYSQEEAKFIQMMDENTTVNKKGFLQMPLPLKDPNISLPCNRGAVFYRTRNTLERLKRDKDKLEDCLKTMDEYIRAGHVEYVPKNQIDPTPGKAWWLPVFPVTHPKKQKTRLVFDSSAEYKGVSLNKALLQGPDNNNSLRGVLMRFRNGPVGVSGDIRCMFHSFYLPEEDRDYVRFFWFDQNKPDNPLIQMRATVHIFGNSPSPAVANYGLKCTASCSNPPPSPDTTNAIMKNFYVDDALIATDSPSEAISLISEAISTLAHFNIRLHKLASNSSEVMEAFPESERITSDHVHLGKPQSCNALGMKWNLSEDSLTFAFNILERPYTKRGLIAVINSLFDPLNIAGPVVLEGRLMVRELLSCGKTLDWDDPLPLESLEAWTKWYSSLKNILTISIPRSYYNFTLKGNHIQELHVYADASKEALGHVIYLRTVTETNVTNAFVCAGSKLAPRSATSIPRLELCAAVEASISASHVRAELNIEEAHCYYYTDSRVTLGYLQNSTRHFSRYVSRRVEIISAGARVSRWFYIKTENNPADIATRPQTPDSLLNSKWLSGPDDLWQTSYTPCPPNILPTEVELPETKLKTVLKTNKKEIGTWCDLVSRARSWQSALNTAKLVISSLHHLDRARQRQGISLAPRPDASNVKTEAAVVAIVNEIQGECDTLSNTHIEMSPFKDSMNTIRVGGRLANSHLPYEGKFPIIIPHDSPLVELLMKSLHNQTRHQGRVITQAAIRYAGFHVKGLKRLVSKFIKKCPTCNRLRGKPLQPKMADLPPSRVQESTPFSYVGIDIFGHFNIIEGHTTRRNSSVRKIYALIFVCQFSRAIHIEAVPGLDTSSCRNALRRFISIRGTPIRILSDNGSNFVAAKAQMETCHALSLLQQVAESFNIEWTMNPPKASSFGGSWERAIGSVRKVLDASLVHLGKRHLTRDEFTTLLQEACSIVNNTPLYEMSDDPNDPIPLTPAHLLCMKDHPSPPFPEEFTPADLNSYGKLRWRRIQYLSTIFWERWQKNYLHTLQSRGKWLKDRPNPEVGDVVVVKQ